MNDKTWKELVALYSRSESEFVDELPPPATDDDIALLFAAAKNEGLHIPQGYVEFLKIRNGTSFNGLMMYGANVPEDDPFRRQDLVAINQFQLNRTNETVLGTNDQDTFVVVGEHGPFRRLDGATWDLREEFQTCEGLLALIFSEQLESLSDD